MGNSIGSEDRNEVWSEKERREKRGNRERRTSWRMKMIPVPCSLSEASFCSQRQVEQRPVAKHYWATTSKQNTYYIIDSFVFCANYRASEQILIVFMNNLYSYDEVVHSVQISHSYQRQSTANYGVCEAATYNVSTATLIICMVRFG